MSKKLLFKIEEPLRNVYSIGYSGTKHQCNICNKKLSGFIVLPNNDLLCPKCGSLARDRRLWQLENSGYIKPGTTILDFSPSRPLARRLKKIKAINYISTDLSGNFLADKQYDITRIDLPAESIDLIICYHILEHIDDDRKAMSELFRVLKKQGTILVQTPFKDGEIYEDFSITDPKQREIHFGQDDHVRFYSVSGLRERLENTGFLVTVSTHPEQVYNGLTPETVLILKKS